MPTFSCSWNEILNTQQWLEEDASAIHEEIFYGELGRAWWDSSHPENDQYRGHRYLAVHFASLLSSNERMGRRDEALEQIEAEFKSIQPAVIKAIEAMRAG